MSEETPPWELCDQCKTQTWACSATAAAEFIYSKSWKSKEIANIDIIKIFHGCELRMENSFLRVTVWHHEAFLMMPNNDPWDGIFYPHQTFMFDSFSCIPFDFGCFILKVAFITAYNDVDVGQDFKMTSLWCQNDVNLTTKLHNFL